MRAVPAIAIALLTAALWSAPSAGQEAFGLGVCCPPSPAPCGIIPCDDVFAGPAIRTMGTSFNQGAMLTIQQPSALSPTGLTGLKPYVDRWLRGLEIATSSTEAAVDRLASVQAVSVESLIQRWTASMTSQVRAEAESRLDADYSAPGQGLACHCDQRENAARELRATEQHTAEVARTLAQKSLAAGEDADGHLGGAGQAAFFREAVAATTGRLFLPPTSTLSPEEAGARSRLAALFFANTERTSGDVDRAARALRAQSDSLAYAALAAVFQGYAAAPDGDLSHAARQIGDALERPLGPGLSETARYGNRRALEAELAFLDAEALTLSARLQGASRHRALLAATALMARVRP